MRASPARCPAGSEGRPPHSAAGPKLDSPPEMRASAHRSRVRGRAARPLAEHRVATCGFLLDDIVLMQRPAAQIGRIRKRREVDGTVFSASDAFGERAYRRVPCPNLYRGGAKVP